jgi:hypothetical protein
MRPPLVALDIGTTKLACAVGRRQDGGGLEVLGHSVVPYPPPPWSWASDPLSLGRLIEGALDATDVAERLREAVVAFSHPELSGQDAQAAIDLADEPITIRSRDVSRLEARALDLALGVDREPLWLERLGCRGNGFDAVADPRGLCATRLTGAFHLITMPQALRRALVRAVEFARLEIARLLPTLIAHAAGAGGAGAPGRALIADVGGTVTSLGLFVGGRLQAARTLAWGGTSFAMSLASAQRLTLEQALTLSLEGMGSPRPEVRDALRTQLDSLGQAAREMLVQGPAPDAVLVAGRAALIDGLLESLERALGLPVAVARSAHTQRLGDLGRQLALSPVLGALAWAAEGEALLRPGRSRAAGRLLDRARELLLAYF